MNYRIAARLAAERLDVLDDPPPKKGCNAHNKGERCGKRIVLVRAGPLSVRRLCADHRDLYIWHDLILSRIRSLG